MNIALVIAGGSGARMGQDIPKQFLNVYDKPVIIYTLEAFQNHPNIDGIEIVCIDGWHEILSAYCKQFHITKLEHIISGGKNGQDSIRNGVYDLKSRHKEEDGISSVRQVPRDNLKVTQTPQAVRLGKLVWAHEEALRRGITNSVATCTMFIELGETLYFSLGSEKNLKLTTPEDIEIFKSLLKEKKAEWMH